MSSFRFAPYSIEAFKRIARDVHRAYPLTLQQSQEALARAFGYPDLHALQEHLKSNPEPGPSGQGADFAALKVDGNFLQVVHEAHGTSGLLHKGRREFQDLYATWDPERRRQAMEFEDEIDRLIDGDIDSQSDTPTTHYVAFEDRRCEDLYIPGVPAREGVFILTPAGDVIRRALRWIEEALDLAAERQDEAEHERLFQRLSHLLRQMPNNPFVLAAWLNFTQFSILDEDGAVPTPDARTAEYIDEVSLIWSLAKDCREMFDALMPANFRGQIVPDLVGIRIENEPYFQVLHIGTLAALALGHTSSAKAWARRSLALDPTDRSSVRRVLAMADDSRV